MGVPPKYMSVLTWKTAERVSLAGLGRAERARVVPVFRVPTSRPKQKQEQEQGRPSGARRRQEWMSEVVEGLAKCSWGGLPILVEVLPGCATEANDVGEWIEALFIQASRRLSLLEEDRLRLVPVLRLTSGPAERGAVARIASMDRRGACLRLTRPDLQEGDLGRRVSEFARDVGVRISEIDLVVDLHFVDESGYDLLVLCAQLPFLRTWRSFTVVGGSFPPGVGRMALGPNLIPRWEWRAYIRESKRLVPRVPWFGDYGVFHPLPFDPGVHGVTPCANIRYAMEDSWLVMKGMQLTSRSGAGPHPGRQFLAMAEQIERESDERGRRIYRGQSYSAGDEYLHHAAERYRQRRRLGKIETGSLTTWLTAGQSTHATLAISQIEEHFHSLQEHAGEAERRFDRVSRTKRRAVQLDIFGGLSTPKTDVPLSPIEPGLFTRG